MELGYYRATLLIFAYIAAVGVPVGQAQQPMTCANQTDSTGPFRLMYRMPLREHQRILSKMEEYVWSHWRSQRPGCLTFRFVTAEGARVDFSMFLEKDEQGTSRVRIERKERQGNYRHPSSQYILRTTRLAYSVGRVDEKRPTDDGYTPFPDSENPRPGMYLLEFKDKDGQVVMRWEPDNTTR
jgi:hypothetical protein